MSALRGSTRGHAVRRRRQKGVPMRADVRRARVSKSEIVGRSWAQPRASAHAATATEPRRHRNSNQGACIEYVGFILESRYVRK